MEKQENGWNILSGCFTQTKSLLWTPQRLKVDTDPCHLLYGSWIKQTKAQYIIFTQKRDKITIRSCPKLYAPNSSSTSLVWIQPKKKRDINVILPLIHLPTTCHSLNRGLTCNNTASLLGFICCQNFNRTSPLGITDKNTDVPMRTSTWQGTKVSRRNTVMERDFLHWQILIGQGEWL